MRARNSKNGISVHVISGTHVVLLAFDADNQARKNLLGFAIQREDHTENEKYWLKGFKTFKEIDDNLIPGCLHSTLFHPVQTFLWGDYTAKPDYKYTYLVRPVYGKPKYLEYGDDIEVTIHTESEDDGKHAVFFNRGTITSQHYAKKFGNTAPDANNIEDERTKWLSRGLLEAALGFIRQAKNHRFGLKVAAYELYYEPVLKALLQYLNKERPPSFSPRLFLVLKGPRKGQPLSTAALVTIIEYHREKSNTPGVECHRLRHTCLTRLRQAGMSLEALQAQAGHKSMTSTGIYLHLCPRELQKEYLRMSELMFASEGNR